MFATASLAEVRVVADFEGGNAEVLALDPATRTLRIAPELRPGRGWPCWWFFKLTGLKPGEPWTLEIQAQSKPFREGSVLSETWCQPKHAWLSTDGTSWNPTPTGTKGEDKVMRYLIESSEAEVQIAWGPPFLPHDAEDLIKEVAGALPESEPFILARTKGGREVHGVRVGKVDAPFQVWINARQHAWEAGGSHVGRGFIRWYASDEARTLRSSACLHFIPIMDVDNVALGAGGKEAMPRDHNRDWAAEPIYPEVAAAQRMIRAIHEKHGLDVYIDLHNPGAGDPVFYFGPFAFERMTGIQQKNYNYWLELSVKHIQKPLPLLPKYRFSTYVKTDEERGRMSSGWVRALNGPSTISATLETAWNSPHMTVEGYSEIGAGLGRALRDYIAENPRE